MRPWLATLLLLAVTAVWGWTFVVVRSAIAVYGVMPFLAMRFVVAAAVMVVLFRRHLSCRNLRAGALIGIILTAGYLMQTWGLRYTTATNSGLITGLFVVLAPVFDRLLFRTRLHPVAWISILGSLVGMSLLTARLPTQLALGDLLTLGCAAAFGIHIAVLSRYSADYSARGLATSQMLGTALIFLLLWPATAEISFPPQEVWFAILLTGVAASALAYTIQTAAQQVLTTVRTAIILTTEPLFAALFGFLLAGERLDALQMLGGALIFASVVSSEVVPALVGARPGDSDDLSE